MFRAVITAGQNAIKTSFLLNGGAAVALLAFIAHMADVKPETVPVFASCMVPFTIGVLIIAVTSGLTYITQWLYQRTSLAGRKAGFWVNILCVVSGIASYLLFAWGQTFAAFK